MQSTYKITMTQPTTGKTYEIHHVRIGIFTMKITSIDDQYITGIVTDTRTAAMFFSDQCEEGDPITISRDLVFRIIKIEDK